MKQDCLDLFAKLEVNRLALQHYLQGYTQSELAELPAADKWSAIMTVHHLIIAESGSMAYVQKKLSFNPELIDATEEQKGMETKVPYMLRSEKHKVEAPLGLGADFLDNTMSLDAAFDQWSEIRLQLRSFLEAQSEEIFSKALYKHPLGGKMRLIGMLMFFDGHQDSHANQIKGNFASMKA